MANDLSALPLRSVQGADMAEAAIIRTLKAEAKEPSRSQRGSVITNNPAAPANSDGPADSIRSVNTSTAAIITSDADNELGSTAQGCAADILVKLDPTGLSYLPSLKISAEMLSRDWEDYGIHRYIANRLQSEGFRSPWAAFRQYTMVLEVGQESYTGKYDDNFFMLLHSILRQHQITFPNHYCSRAPKQTQKPESITSKYCDAQVPLLPFGLVVVPERLHAMRLYQEIRNFVRQSPRFWLVEVICPPGPYSADNKHGRFQGSPYRSPHCHIAIGTPAEIGCLILRKMMELQGLSVCMTSKYQKEFDWITTGTLNIDLLLSGVVHGWLRHTVASAHRIDAAALISGPGMDKQMAHDIERIIDSHAVHITPVHAPTAEEVEVSARFQFIDIRCPAVWRAQKPFLAMRDSTYDRYMAALQHAFGVVWDHGTGQGKKRVLVVAQDSSRCESIEESLKQFVQIAGEHEAASSAIRVVREKVSIFAELPVQQFASDTDKCIVLITTPKSATDIAVRIQGHMAMVCIDPPHDKDSSVFKMSIALGVAASKVTHGAQLITILDSARQIERHFASSIAIHLSATGRTIPESVRVMSEKEENRLFAKARVIELGGTDAGFGKKDEAIHEFVARMYR